ncbi:MAG TPA: hypothetical protein VLB80_00400 [Candidatus Babeliales bacterium]|nr:hypothetical protein [Candidatus Babeliales bacterium]
MITSLRIGFLITFITFTQYSLCMDTLGYGHILREIIVSNDITLLDHNSLCLLALVDKSWHDKIRATAKSRREYLERHVSEPLIDSQTTWHKYGSAYSYWQNNMKLSKVFHFNGINRKGIYLQLVFLNENTTIDQKYLECSPSESLENPLFDNNKPSFNAEGKVCFHARGWMYSKEWGECGAIFEYSLDTHGQQKTLQCFVDIGSSKPLSNFTSYPVLFQAFINSQKITENESTKIYHVKGIRLDENYIATGKFPNPETKEKIITQCIKTLDTNPLLITDVSSI